MQRALLGWFDSTARSIAFRRSTDPYAVLVAEVMAQQTQVARVAPAWTSFMAAFPTVHALGRASVADVVRAWAGLGYNRRAVNLHRAAAAIVERHAGVVPSDPDLLQQLPGVGPYTARAVAATAFGRAVAPVDTNVRRVLGRVLGAGRPGEVSRPVLTADLQRTADQLVDRGRPADWTHALMDVGATICRPARVDCDRCPLRPWCATARRGSGSQLQIAGARRRADRGAPKAPPFPATSRWLRGRLIALLVAAPDGAWQRVAGPVGVHSAAEVESTLAALTREALIERGPDGRVRLPINGEVVAATALR